MSEAGDSSRPQRVWGVARHDEGSRVAEPSYATATERFDAALRLSLLAWSLAKGDARDDLIAAKRAAERPQDNVDADKLSRR